MNIYPLRHSDEARRFLLQGLWWQRAAAPSAATVRPALEWALQAASNGQALPPLGFIADLGLTAFGAAGDARPGRVAAVPGLPIQVVRTYEDHVLGKFYADWSFGRAADALRRTEGRDRARGLAFVLDRFRERSGFDGVDFSPGVLKGLLDQAPEDVLRQGWESLRQEGADEWNTRLYQSLIEAVRAHGRGAGAGRRGRGGSGRRPGRRGRAAGPPPGAPGGRRPGGGPAAPPAAPAAARARRPRASSTRAPTPSAASRPSPRAAASRAFCTRSWRTWSRTSGPTCST